MAVPRLKTQTIVHLVSSDKAFLRMAEEAFAVHDARIEPVMDLADIDASMTNVVLVCDENSPSPIECLVRYPTLHHVVMKSDLGTIQQLHVLASKLQGGRWGIRDYLQPGASTHTLRVTDYGKKQSYIDQVRSYAASIPNGFNDLATMAATVTWELIMNGLFNAPRLHGEPKYRDVSRRRDLVVETDEAVELSYGHDDRSLVIAMSDSFGALTRDTVVQNLERASRSDRAQIQRATQGAGVGLYVVYRSSSQLDIQIAPGQRTDVTAVIRLSKRYKDFERSGHSIHFFIEELKRS